MGAWLRTSGRAGREDQGEGIPGVLGVLVAGQGGEWRSRTAETVAGTPVLRADATPEVVATREDAGPHVVLDRAQFPLWVEQNGDGDGAGGGRGGGRGRSTCRRGWRRTWRGRTPDGEGWRRACSAATTGTLRGSTAGVLGGGSADFVRRRTGLR